MELPGVQPGNILSPSNHPAVPLTSTHSQCGQGVGNGGLSMQRSARSDLRCPVFWYRKQEYLVNLSEAECQPFKASCQLVHSQMKSRVLKTSPPRSIYFPPTWERLQKKLRTIRQFPLLRKSTSLTACPTPSHVKAGVLETQSAGSWGHPK